MHACKCILVALSATAGMLTASLHGCPQALSASVEAYASAGRPVHAGVQRLVLNSLERLHGVRLNGDADSEDDVADVEEAGADEDVSAEVECGDLPGGKSRRG